MNFDPIFRAIEQMDLSIWLRESLFGFAAVITVHTIGMALLAGGSAMIDLRLLGLAPHVPMAALTRFLPVIWFGFLLNALSGIFLLIAYPTKAFTNPVFYTKLLLIAAAIVLLLKVKDEVLNRSHEGPLILPSRARLLAGLSLASWAATIVAGRLLPYTCTRLLVRIASCS